MRKKSFVGHYQWSTGLLASVGMMFAIQGVAHAQCNWTAGPPITESCGLVGIFNSNPTFALDVGSLTDTTKTGIRSIRPIQTWGGVGQPQAALYLKTKLLTGQLSNNFGPGIVFFIEDSDTTEKIMGRLGVVRDGGDNIGKLVVQLGTASGETDRFIISNSGVQAVGVPLTANYSDLAEWVSVKGSSDPGTVVVIHDGGLNEVAPAHKAYDTGVAGVVSAKPGIVLGEAGEGKATIATTGRVRVKVDASKNPILVGDLLVTSDREGYAMKSEPVEVAGVRIHRPGTLIGKALEPIESGDGEILVLLSLQ